MDSRVREEASYESKLHLSVFVPCPYYKMHQNNGAPVARWDQNRSTLFRTLNAAHLAICHTFCLPVACQSPLCTNEGSKMKIISKKKCPEAKKNAIKVMQRCCMKRFTVVSPFEGWVTLSETPTVSRLWWNLALPHRKVTGQTNSSLRMTVINPWLTLL